MAHDEPIYFGQVYRPYYCLSSPVTICGLIYETDSWGNSRRLPAIVEMLANVTRVKGLAVKACKLGLTRVLCYNENVCSFRKVICGRA